MTVKFTKTAKGEVAIMPRAEYEQLIERAREAEEDAGVARLIARAKKEVASGKPLLPKNVVDRLAKGENPIRVLREFRELSQVELAAAVGIAQGYLSDLESEKRKGPLELHQKVARALGVPLELLAPIAVPLAEADPERLARREQAFRDMKRQRRYRT
jgi:DNA-binding XRE family transcriptional regulator